jgi:hypothetical protein
MRFLAASLRPFLRRAALPPGAIALAWALSGCVVHEYAAHPTDTRFRQAVHVSAEGALVRSSLNPNRCLDAKGGQAVIRGEVWLYECHGRENQRWSFVDVANGGSAVEGIGGLCLDAVEWPTQKERTRVQLYPCAEDQVGETFRVYADGRIHEIFSDRCLTVGGADSGTPVTLEECDLNDNGQIWLITR